MSQHEEPVDVTEPAAPIAEPVEAENADVDVEVDADVDAEVDVVDVPGREASLLAHKHQTRETLREFGIDIQDTPADGIADYRQWLAYIARRRGLVYRRGGRGLQPIGISQVFGDKPTAFVLVVEDGDVEENAYWLEAPDKNPLTTSLWTTFQNEAFHFYRTVTVALPSPPVCLLAGLESFRDIYHKRLVEMISSSLLENAFDQPEGQTAPTAWALQRLAEEYPSVADVVASHVVTARNDNVEPEPITIARAVESRAGRVTLWFYHLESPSDTKGQWHPEGKGLKGTGLLEETFALDACLRYGYDNDPYVNEMDKYALVTLVGYEDLRPALQSSLKTETAKAAKERASVKRSRAAAQAKAERQAKSERAHARPKPGKRQLPKRR